MHHSSNPATASKIVHVVWIGQLQHVFGSASEWHAYPLAGLMGDLLSLCAGKHVPAWLFMTIDTNHLVCCYSLVMRLTVPGQGLGRDHGPHSTRYGRGRLSPATAALASKPNSWPATAKGSTGQAYPTSKPGGRQVHLRVQPE